MRRLRVYVCEKGSADYEGTGNEQRLFVNDITICRAASADMVRIRNCSSSRLVLATISWRINVPDRIRFYTSHFYIWKNRLYMNKKNNLATIRRDGSRMVAEIGSRVIDLALFM